MVNETKRLSRRRKSQNIFSRSRLPSSATMKTMMVVVMVALCLGSGSSLDSTSTSSSSAAAAAAATTTATIESNGESSIQSSSSSGQDSLSNRTTATTTTPENQKEVHLLKERVSFWRWEQERTVNACRRNPTWEQPSATTNDGADVDAENDDHDDIVISYDVCRDATGASEWMPRIVDEDWVASSNDEDREKEFVSHRQDAFEYWKRWWKQQNKDAELKTCLHADAQQLIAQQCQANNDNDNNDDEEEDYFPASWKWMSIPRAVSIYSHVDQGDLVTVENALTECEAAYLETMIHCMETHLPADLPFYQERPFGQDESSDAYGLYKESGGNHVHYVAGIIQRYLPGVVHSLYTAIALAYDYGKWGHAETFAEDEKMFSGGPGFPHPTTLGLRTAEYLQYHTTGRLGQHADAESIFTISVALANPEDYEGGQFQLLSDAVKFKLPRLSAAVFFSEASHGIAPLTAGKRSVFVTELWDYPAVPMGSSRPSVEQFLEALGIDPDEYDEDDEDETEEEE